MLTYENFVSTLCATQTVEILLEIVDGWTSLCHSDNPPSPKGGWGGGLGGYWHQREQIVQSLALSEFVGRRQIGEV